MRDIKFRAWDKGVNRIYSSEYMKEMSVFALNSTHSNKDFLVLPIMSDVILMQYTGLKDKQGVEIYEGDILECWLKYQSYKPTFIEDVKVIDLNNTLPFSRQFNIENKTYKDRVGECEVIGNIYENPELLK